MSRERFQMYKPRNKMEIEYRVNSLSGPTDGDMRRWEEGERIKEVMRELIEKVNKAERAMAELGEIIDEMIEYDAPGYEIDEMIDAYHGWEQYHHKLEEYLYDLGDRYGRIYR